MRINKSGHGIKGGTFEKIVAKKEVAHFLKPVLGSPCPDLKVRRREDEHNPVGTAKPALVLTLFAVLFVFILAKDYHELISISTPKMA